MPVSFPRCRRPLCPLSSCPPPTLSPKLPPLPASHSPWGSWLLWIGACFLLCSCPLPLCLVQGEAHLQRSRGFPMEKLSWMVAGAQADGQEVAIWLGEEPHPQHPSREATEAWSYLETPLVLQAPQAGPAPGAASESTAGGLPGGPWPSVVGMGAGERRGAQLGPWLESLLSAAVSSPRSHGSSSSCCCCHPLGD